MAEPNRVKVAAIFILDGPGMEGQGLLLASTLRAQTPPGTPIIAYLPQHSHPPPAQPVRAAFEALEVELTPLEVPQGTWAKPYPHGNKVLAAAQHRACEATFFFDTDTLVAAPLDPAGLIRPGAISAAPEGRPTWGHKSDRWERVYRHFDLDLPEERIQLRRGRRRMFVPYYNAGVVGFWQTTDGTPGFGQHWLETAREIDHQAGVGGKRPWLDQIALPVTCARFGYEVSVLDDAYNFSISNRPFDGETPTILHYHRQRYCVGWPQFSDGYLDMMRRLGPGILSRLPAHVQTYWNGMLCDDT